MTHSLLYCSCLPGKEGNSKLPKEVALKTDHFGIHFRLWVTVTMHGFDFPLAADTHTVKAGNPSDVVLL
jgi:hypothetical protein